MLCEKLARRTGILLKVSRTAKFLKLSDLCIKNKIYSFEYYFIGFIIIKPIIIRNSVSIHEIGKA